MSSNRRALTLLLSLWAVAAGCAKEREPRSFVQPNALRKADLQGTSARDFGVTPLQGSFNHVILTSPADLAVWIPVTEAVLDSIG